MKRTIWQNDNWLEYNDRVLNSKEILARVFFCLQAKFSWKKKTPEKKALLKKKRWNFADWKCLFFCVFELHTYLYFPPFLSYLNLDVTNVFLGGGDTVISQLFFNQKNKGKHAEKSWTKL